mmetsp:Transcript_395/g.1178  ORF Transcript_395/g.1178 Transcript_395/m.1178 type:complete len:111 (+) Transcript_395:189-521(+)
MVKIIGINGEIIAVEPALQEADMIAELKGRVAKKLQKKKHQVQLIDKHSQLCGDGLTIKQLPGGLNAELTVMLIQAERKVAFVDTARGDPLEDVCEIPLAAKESSCCAVA